MNCPSDVQDCADCPFELVCFPTDYDDWLPCEDCDTIPHEFCLLKSCIYHG